MFSKVKYIIFYNMSNYLKNPLSIIKYLDKINKEISHVVK